MPVEWAKNPAFEEVATALSIDADHVMAMMESDNRITVLYTPDLSHPTSNPAVYVAMFEREEGAGVLRLRVEPHEIPGYWEKLEAAVAARLEELDDDGG